MKETSVKLYIDGTAVDTHPIYSDNISVEQNREEGEMFRRTKLNAEFTFVAEDYTLIYNSTINTAFEVRVYDKESDTLLATGTFEKTDCSFDIDNKQCKVKVTSADKYDKILARINDEFDLISLTPKRESITLRKRGILQIYFLGDSKVTNIVGNTSYEINAQREIMSANELADMGFIPLKKYATFTFISNEDVPSIPSEALGTYSGIYVDSNSRFTNENGYYFTYTSSYPMQQRLHAPNGVVVPNIYLETTTIDIVNLSSFNIVTRSTPQAAGVRIGEGVLNRAFSYARVLVDSTDFDLPLSSYYTLDSNDVCSNNLNYRYAMQANIGGLANLIIASDEVQDEPTKWGVNGEGKYYIQPNPIAAGDNVIPIGWNKWIPMSFWLNSTEALTFDLDMFNTSWKLNDAFPLYDVIKVLLAEIDPNISFDGTEEYSRFIYGQIEWDEIFGRMKQLLYITPVTNIKKTYYNQAARKGKITLGQILDMLRNTCQLYWFIDDQNRLRIEHITWFKRGGTYDSHNPIVDLTSVVSPMSRKTWSFGQNTFDYNKSALVKRYEFGWNEECTEAFNGFPIDIKDKFVGNGKTEKVVVSNFISDIDLIMSAPDNLSDDCFAIIGTFLNGVCPIVDVEDLEGGSQDFVAPHYWLQNAFLSFFFLEKTYWTYDLGGREAETSYYHKANGENGALLVRDIKRVKRQKIKFPLNVADVNKEGLITTSLGIGEWVESKYTPEDGMVEMTIIMETMPLPLIIHDYPTKFSEGVMEVSFDESRDNRVVVTFDGKQYVDDADWAYVFITANRDCSVTMNSDTEGGYDIGWADDTPRTIHSDAFEARYYVSGKEERRFELLKGEGIYIGYTKDGSEFGFSDIVTFTIVEN